MMNEIETAFGQRLTMSPALATAVWPNRTAEPAKPYLNVQHVPTTNENNSMDGSGGEVQRGYFIVTVVTETNEFSTSANTLAESVRARFPMGLTLSAESTRKMRIWRPAQMLPAMRDEANFEQPVRLDYIVTGK